MNSRLLGAVFAVILTGTAQAEESYLCVSDLITGFTYEESSGWRQANFKPSKTVLVKKPSRDDQGLFNKAEFVVSVVGEKGAWSGCGSGFNEAGILVCRGIMSFEMNKKTLRFISIYNFGFLTFEERQGEQVDDVTISIGKCSSL